jgi:hypothetical protein
VNFPCLAVLLMLAQVGSSGGHRSPADRVELREAAESFVGSDDPCGLVALVAAAMSAGGLDAPQAVTITAAQLLELPRGSVAVIGLGADDDLDRRVAGWLAEGLAGSCIPLVDPNEAMELAESEADLRYLIDADPARARSLLLATPADFLVKASVEVSISSAQQIYGISAYESRARATASSTRSIDGSIASVVESSAKSVRTDPQAAVDDAVRECVRLLAISVAEDILLESLRAADGIRLVAIDASEGFGGPLAVSLSRRLAGRGSAIWDPEEGRVVLSPRLPDQEIEAALREQGMTVTRRGFGTWTIAEGGGAGRSRPGWDTMAWAGLAVIALASGIAWVVLKRGSPLEGGRLD